MDNLRVPTSGRLECREQAPDTKRVRMDRRAVAVPAVVAGDTVALAAACVGVMRPQWADWVRVEYLRPLREATP